MFQAIPSRYLVILLLATSSYFCMISVDSTASAQDKSDIYRNTSTVIEVDTSSVGISLSTLNMSFKEQRNLLWQLETELTQIDLSSGGKEELCRFNEGVGKLSNIVKSQATDSLIRRGALYVLLSRSSKDLSKQPPQLESTGVIKVALEDLLKNSSQSLLSLLKRTIMHSIPKLEADQPVVNVLSTNNDQQAGNDVQSEIPIDSDLKLSSQPLAATSLPTVGNGTGTAGDQLPVSVTRSFDPERDAYSSKRRLRGENRKKSTDDAVRKKRAVGAIRATGGIGIPFKPAVVPKREK